MLHKTNSFIEYSVDYDGNIEDLYIDEEENVTKEEIETLIKKVVDNVDLICGERNTGTIEILDDKIIFDSEYCSELGDDWNDDIWEYNKFEIPNS